MRIAVMREISVTASVRSLMELLEQRTGQILSDGRMWRIEASLGPVLRARGFASLDALVDAIRNERGDALATEVVDALLNNETSFFRDPHIFEMIGRHLLPAAMERATVEGRGKTLRVWCAGCSSGQEAWSLAMLFLNGRTGWPEWKMEILATDISHSAIARARSGIVPQMEAQRGLPVSDMLRWMEPEGDHWRISPTLRDMVEFQVDNLFAPEAPRGTYDMILCRNVLLYFTAEKKQQLFAQLARHASPGGWLLLGAGETSIGLTADFSSCPEHRGAYRRSEAA